MSSKPRERRGRPNGTGEQCQCRGDLSRCDAEIAEIEAAIRAGVEPVENALQGLQDWRGAQIDSRRVMKIVQWAIDRLIPYARNARKIPHDAIDNVAASIKEFGWRQPIVVDAQGVIIAGHARLLAARKLNLTEVPVHVADSLSPAQVKAYRLMDNRSHDETSWDFELLGPELLDLQNLGYGNLELTGFDPKEIDDLLLVAADDQANSVPPLPDNPVSRPGDLWLCGDGRRQHRVLCSDAASAEAVARLLGERKPKLLVTDPPYGIELDSEWRDRAGLNGCGPAESSHRKTRTEGHTETAISGDRRADWSEAFELAPSIQVAYVWHASVFTREVLNGLLRIGFLYPQQIIWNKGRTVLTRTHYWYQYEPCWYVRKRTLPGSARPVRTRRYGTRHRRNSSWVDRTKRNSITQRRSRSI